MKLKIAALITAFLGTNVLADGFSATLDAGIVPGFSAAASLNYSVNVLPQLVVGASISPGVFLVKGIAYAQIISRIGAVFVNRFDLNKTLYLDIYGGIGANALIVPNFQFLADASAGAFVNQELSFGAIYGGLDFHINLSQNLDPSLRSYATLKANLNKDLALYFENNLGISSVFNYNLRLGLSYTIVPQVKIGTSFSYSPTTGGFVVALTGQFTEKPETLGTPGNYLP